ncbi:hypothetical protein A1O3_01299 [Capronia epimyces CBS 606.96]|uniref:Uncharacterized protein n=1 Tax=Capronia epimyces CBS 606.96 TaxID=1182542 RepID=W9YIM7_9EURO|nr:uncharacterized protein A1O3_01299 [Capronia epimyces CBS 606.96]EXJ92747.1 hypothetical protein A1O3_01299 [Capronia epimyces CBS 606.96]
MATEGGKETYVEDEGAAGPNGAGAVKAKPPFKQRAKRHCLRFWWLWFIIFAIVVLVIVLPIVYVAYPNKAQKQINKAQLVPQSMSLLDPAPDSFDLQLDDMFQSKSSMTARLDAFTADLQLPGAHVPFVRIDVPAIKAANGSVAHVHQRVQIANTDQFDQYTKTVLLSDEYSIYLKGKGGLKYGSLPKTTVKYNKKITIKGLNGLKGLTLTDFAILTTTQADGANANGTVTIPNPSIATYQLGNVSLAMSVAGLPVGTATLPDVLLKPGNNSFPMRAITNQTAVVDLIFTNYKSGILPIDIVGNTSVYAGKHLPYYEQALQANNVTIRLDVIKALEDAGLAQYLGINTTSTG